MTRIPNEVQSVLQKFRRWIRRYILLEGFALLVAVGCLMFWVTFLVDLFYFQFSNLELPSTFRLICLLGMVGGLSGIGISWVALRLFRQFRLRDLALVLERRFPQLRDQLITTVEMEHEVSGPLQADMLRQTSQEAAKKVAQIPLEETFDRTPLKRLVIAAGVLFCTLAAFGVANAAGVERWVNAYLLTTENYWDPFRQQALSVKIITQPGEQVKEFDENRMYKHPRGADLQLLVESQESAIAPDGVSIQYIAFTGNTTTRGRSNMSRFGENQFRHTISRLVDDHHLWIRGGDFVNRLPYRIQVVDPPQVNQMTLACDYPSYTGMDGLEDQLVPVVSSLVSIPMETKFELQAECNKEIRAVDIRSNRFQFSFGFSETEGKLTAKPTTLVLRDEENRILQSLKVNASAEDFLSEDGTHFTVPMQVTMNAETAWESLTEPVELPLAIPPDAKLSIYLEDEHDIYSPEPAEVSIQGIVDEPPVVDTKRTGIGTLVTRNAQIPIEGTLSDDYGVVNAWFGVKHGGVASERTFPLKNLPTNQTEFQLDDATPGTVERFNLRPLKLDEGTSFTLSVYALDGDQLNGPNAAHGEIFSFKVVSVDELEARLIDREVNLRSRFEQIRAEVGDLRDLLVEQIESDNAEATSVAPDDDSLSLLSSFVERSLHQLRKNQTESRSVEISFRDLREEMVNNGIDSREKLERIDQGILAPMKILNDQLFATADERYALQRLSLQRNSGIGDALQETLPAVDAVIEQMDQILEEMRDRGTYGDLIQAIQRLRDDQEKLLKMTEEKRIEENFLFDFSQ